MISSTGTPSSSGGRGCRATLMSCSYGPETSLRDSIHRANEASTTCSADRAAHCVVSQSHYTPAKAPMYSDGCTPMLRARRSPEPTFARAVVVIGEQGNLTYLYRVYRGGSHERGRPSVTAVDPAGHYLGPTHDREIVGVGLGTDLVRLQHVVGQPAGVEDGGRGDRDDRARRNSVRHVAARAGGVQTHRRGVLDHGAHGLQHHGLRAGRGAVLAGIPLGGHNRPRPVLGEVHLGPITDSARRAARAPARAPEPACARPRRQAWRRFPAPSAGSPC